MIDTLLALAIGVAGGASAAHAFRARQSEPQPRPIRQPVEVDISPLYPGEAAKPEPQRADPATEQAALDLLDVADRISSEELVRRLIDAIGRIEGVVIERPETGTPFDPDRHIWAETTPIGADTIRQVETVDHCHSVGLARPDGSVLRQARVAVYDR